MLTAVAQMQMPTLPVDKDVRIGKLSNGLTYYIRYNNWPENARSSTSHSAWARFRKTNRNAD